MLELESQGSINDDGLVEKARKAIEELQSSAKVDEKKEDKDVEMQIDKEEKVEAKEVPKEGMDRESP